MPVLPEFLLIFFFFSFPFQSNPGDIIISNHMIFSISHQLSAFEFLVVNKQTFHEDGIGLFGQCVEKKSVCSTKTIKSIKLHAHIRKRKKANEKFQKLKVRIITNRRNCCFCLLFFFLLLHILSFYLFLSFGSFFKN